MLTRAKNTFSITVTESTESSLTLRLEGDLLSENLSAVREFLESNLRASVSRLVLNLEGVSFMASSALQFLFDLWHQLKTRQGNLVLTNLHPNIRRILRLTRTDKILLDPDENNLDIPGPKPS